MDNNSNMLQLCRLCLVKDDVNIPIFEEQGDIRQIFLKISSCLPVKVSRDDQLPKKICDGCSYKLDMLYEFWNTSANAEKQLLTWLGEAGMTSQMTDGTISAVAQQIKPADAFVKQETIDPPDIHMDDDEEEDKDYMKVEEVNNVEEPPPKRARRTAAVKAAIAIDQNSDDDDDSGEPMTKVEDDSEDSDNEDHEPAFVDVPSTSADDQPGPSGVSKDGVEAPKHPDLKNSSYKDDTNKELERHFLSTVNDKQTNCDQSSKKFDPDKWENVAASQDAKLDKLLANQTLIMHSLETVLKKQAKHDELFRKYLGKTDEPVSFAQEPVPEGQNPEQCLANQFKPIELLEELVEFEDKLKDKAVVDDMLYKMSFICGTKGRGIGLDNCYKLVDFFFTRHFMTMCSWAGGSREQREKIPFKMFKNVITLFFQLVSLSDNEFTLEQCENFFKMVLKNSTRRNEISKTGIQRSSKSKRRPKKLVYRTRCFTEPTNELQIDQIVEDVEIDSKVFQDSLGINTDSENYL